MSELNERIAELEARLDSLVRTQIDFQREIGTIRRELTNLRTAGTTTTPITSKLDQNTIAQEPSSAASGVPPHAQPPPPQQSYRPDQTRYISPPTFGQSTQGEAEATRSSTSAFVESNRGNLEKFVGRSLIALAGIVVLVLGVGIGAKYAIDNGWISPMMRIIFGYVIGFVLIGVAVKLKPKYLTFSAVLLSGGMAIMYFVTYFAYSYYALMPQSAAFVLMAAFTIFTVAAAIVYERQVIAHIGLVGAYAVPFLLSDNSGNYLFLFIYIAIINCGILAISIRKYWRSLYYAAFVFTWLIFASWFFDKYAAAEHFYLALAFSAIYFGIFYLVGMAYRLRTDKFGLVEAGLVFADSFVFYGFTYAVFDSREELRVYEGLLTGGHAVLHSLTAQVISRLRPAAVDIVQVLTILIITFSTIAIPVQFDGNTITLMWTVESAALFWYGRARSVPLFEKFSYPLMFLASCSLFAVWLEAALNNPVRTPILNGDFATEVVFVAAFAFIYYVNRKTNQASAFGETFVRSFGMIVGTLGLFVLYNAFRIEIGNYFHLRLVAAQAATEGSALLEPVQARQVGDIVRFNGIWQLNYTMAFLLGLMTVNLMKVRSTVLAIAGVILSAIPLFIFVTAGMYVFYELRVSYMLADAAAVMNVGVRYVSYCFAAALLTGIYLTGRSEMITEIVPTMARELIWSALVYGTVLIAASCELINLMEQARIADADKLGLSILWGAYALMLIVLGIAWNKKHLRIGAIVLLAITLVKLFLYDVADLPTIPKTILFVSLGTLLLIVSFLYNKFAVRIFNRTANTDG